MCSYIITGMDQPMRETVVALIMKLQWNGIGDE